MFIDTHCHLGFEQLGSNSEPKTLEFLQKAKQNLVSIILNISTDIHNFENYLNFNKKLNTLNNNVLNYPKMYTAIGIHPLHIKDNLDFTEQNIQKYLDDKNLIALGETGLDEYYTSNKEDLILQTKFFEIHNNIAIQNNLPVIVHTRNSQQKTLEVLSYYVKNHNLKGVIHCFSGNKEFAKKLLDLNFYISFSGIVTFKKSTEIQEVAKYVPSSYILTETDAPYLSPEPHRGKINEPSYVKYTSEFLAKIRNEKIHDFTSQVECNFFSLFNKATK